MGTTDAVFTVSLSAAYDEDVTVGYITFDDTAVTGSDYVATAGTLRIPAGETSGTINVPVIGDQRSENDESYSLELANPSINAALGAHSSFGGILDDDPPEISIYNVTRQEGNTGTTSVTFGVGLSMASGQAISVHYATASDSGTAGSDYQSTSGTVTFAPGRRGRPSRFRSSATASSKRTRRSPST